jgi:hypothetical protein
MRILVWLFRWLFRLIFSAWTTPATWAASQLVTASDLNVQMRDNLGYLFARPQVRILRDNGADYTTTSSSFVPVDSTNLKITLTISGSAVLLCFIGVFYNTTANEVHVDLDVDGSRVGSAGNDGLAFTGQAPATVSIVVLVTGLTPGAHTFNVQWRADGGTAHLHSGSGVGNEDHIPVFSAVEVG